MSRNPESKEVAAASIGSIEIGKSSKTPAVISLNIEQSHGKLHVRIHTSRAGLIDKLGSGLARQASPDVFFEVVDEHNPLLLAPTMNEIAKQVSTCVSAISAALPASIGSAELKTGVIRSKEELAGVQDGRFPFSLPIVDLGTTGVLASLANDTPIQMGPDNPPSGALPDPSPQFFPASERAGYLPIGARQSVIEALQRLPNTGQKNSSLDPATISTLGPPGHEYPLRDDGAAAVYENGILTLGPLTTTGATLEEGLSAMGNALHRRFQHLWNKAPHERTVEEVTEWGQLASLVDVDAYRSAHPPEELVLGRVTTIDNNGMTVVFLTDEPEQTIVCSWSDLPGAAAAASIGDHFSARIRRYADERITWKDWTFRPPLDDSNAVWDEFDTLSRSDG